MAVWVATIAVALVILYTGWAVFVGPRLQHQSRISTPQLNPNPPLELLSYNGTRAHSYLTVEGQVRNVTGERLERIMAVVECYGSAGEFVTSEDAMIEYLPLMPGQTSPFKVMIRDNPTIKTFKVGFKEMFGGSIPYTDFRSQPPPSRLPKK